MSNVDGQGQDQPSGRSRRIAKLAALLGLAMIGLGMAAGADGPITANLRRLAPEAPVGEPAATPVSGVSQVKVGGKYVYLSQDGRYAFLGDLVDLSTGTNLTETTRSKDTLAALAGFPEGDMAVFPAKGNETGRITVFTDSTCPYCRKLHGEVPALQEKGVTVRYIPFPRQGQEGQGYRDLRAIWCAADRRHALDIATGVSAGELGSGDCPAADAVMTGYRLGVQEGLQGTPTIVLPDGQIFPGFMSRDQLLTALHLPSDATK
jgi:thiol:disulfide interchange protein DsbC